MKAVVAGIIAVIVIGGGAFWYLKDHPAKKPNTTASTTSTTSSNQTSSEPPTNTPNANPATPTGGGSVDTMTITANDTSASPDTINVKQGDTVKLTFNVSTQGTYHGGLEFKSTDPAVDSGSIAEGSSKTVTFTATKSFKFTPYWYQSSVQKDYFVTVNVR